VDSLSKFGSMNFRRPFGEFSSTIVRPFGEIGVDLSAKFDRPFGEFFSTVRRGAFCQIASLPGSAPNRPSEEV
jgi:hypothetical protein